MAINSTTPILGAHKEAIDKCLKKLSSKYEDGQLRLWHRLFIELSKNGYMIPKHLFYLASKTASMIKTEILQINSDNNE